MNKINIRKEENYIMVFEEGTHNKVELFRDSWLGGDQNWKINWPAKGSVSVEDAKEFQKLLDKAITLADELNRSMEWDRIEKEVEKKLAK